MGGDNMALSNEDLKAIESMLEPIKRDIRSIQLTLENESRRIKERIESIA